MKPFIKGPLHDMDVDEETLDLDSWQKPIPRESFQTIRNIGRIDQLEAGQTDLREAVKQIQTFIQSSSSPWATTKSWFAAAHLSGQEVDISLWEQAQLAMQPIGSSIGQIAPTYREKLSTVTKLFADLEEDFDDIPRRIVRCELLEKELAALEDSLEDEETEHFGWCVSLIRDVLDYNYAEKFTEAHLGLLKKGIDLIFDKGARCNKEDYQNLHKEFLQSGLALIPTTQKAIDKYGD